MNKCELLAPAGSPDALRAAVLSGADAVYLGGNVFNARASANNFDDKQLEDAIDFCHLHRVKVYITVNILIADREFDEFDRFIKKIYSFGADGVIVQDIGAAMRIKEIAPDFKLHGSTQMTVYDLEGAIFLKNLGFERVVLARELSAHKIKEITEKSGIETEIFVHGAMCVCYSGQCLMSSVIGGRSGNRGKCAQPCRLKYYVNKKNGFLMSLKDMCLINHIEDIKSSDVSSLKIEGRMKGPDYVGTVISVYRKYLDSTYNVTDDDYNTLERVFYRGGFSDGYYMGQKGAHMFCHTKPDNPYLKQDRKYVPSMNFKRTKVKMSFVGTTGKPLFLRAVDEYGNIAEYNSENLLEPAQNAAASKDKVVSQLSKLGDTIFALEGAEVELSDDVFVPVSEINKARRFVTEVLSEKIIKLYKRNTSSSLPSHTKHTYTVSGMQYSVMVTTLEQLLALRTTDCKKIYAPLELAEDFLGDEIVVLPRITPDNLEAILSSINNTDVLIRNIGQLNIAKKCNKNIHIDFTMNVFNGYSAEFFFNLGAKSITLSTELTINQIRDIAKLGPCEAVIYGKVPLMITENCMIKTSVGCQKGGYITDRTNERFLIKCLPDCRNEIFNSKPIVMSDKQEDLLYAKIAYGRLYFVDESSQKCVDIYNQYKKKLPLNTDFTRGKFYKGV